MRGGFAGLTVCAMLASPVAAQVALGRFDTGTQFVAQSVRSLDMGRCAVRADRRHAASLVLSPAGDPRQAAVMEALKPALVRCLGGTRSATLDAGYLRGGIAEALLDENADALLTSASARVPVVPTRLPDRTAEPIVAIMGCAVAAQPVDAAAMLKAPPGTAAETASFRALIPSLQACAPADGEIRFSPARMRPATAIALYRQVAVR